MGIYCGPAHLRRSKGVLCREVDLDPKGSFIIWRLFLRHSGKRVWGGGGREENGRYSERKGWRQKGYNV